MTAATAGYNKLARINLATPNLYWTGAEAVNDIVVHGMLPSQKILLGGSRGSSNAAVSIQGNDANVTGKVSASAVAVSGAISLSLSPTAQLGIGGGNAIASAASTANATWSSNAASWSSNLLGGGGGSIVGVTNVGVGTASPEYPVHVASRGSNNVSIFVAGDVMSLSDATVKRDIRKIDRGALDRTCLLSGYTYAYAVPGEVKGEGTGNPESRSAGLLAQEVAQQLPEAVRRDGGTDLLSVSYAGMFALIVEAIKELRAEIESVKDKARVGGA